MIAMLVIIALKDKNRPNQPHMPAVLDISVKLAAIMKQDAHLDIINLIGSRARVTFVLQDLIARPSVSF